MTVMRMELKTICFDLSGADLARHGLTADIANELSELEGLL